MPNYMYYDYKTSQICKIKENKANYSSTPSIQSYLNTLCLQHGSTLQGRKQAFMYIMDKKRFIPIVISLNPVLIFFPIHPIQDPHCIWINYANIKNILYQKNTCEILFKDSTRLTCLHPKRIHSILKNIWRFLQIQNYE